MFCLFLASDLENGERRHSSGGGASLCGASDAAGALSEHRLSGGLRTGRQPRDSAGRPVLWHPGAFFLVFFCL